MRIAFPSCSQAPAAKPVDLSEEEQMRMFFPTAFGQTKKAAAPDLKAVLAQTRREAVADEAPAVGPARPPVGGGGGGSDGTIGWRPARRRFFGYPSQGMRQR